MSKFEVGYSDDSLRMPKGWLDIPPNGVIWEPGLKGVLKRLWRRIMGKPEPRSTGPLVEWHTVQNPDGSWKEPVRGD